MKIRLGFVSNSSSSSLLLMKNDIPEDLLSLVTSLVECSNQLNNFDTDIDEREDKFIGFISYHNEILVPFLKYHQIPFESEG